MHLIPTTKKGPTSSVMQSTVLKKTLFEGLDLCESQNNFAPTQLDSHRLMNNLKPKANTNVVNSSVRHSTLIKMDLFQGIDLADLNQSNLNQSTNESIED